MIKIRYDIETGRVNLISNSGVEIPVEGMAYITVLSIPEFSGDDALYVEDGELVVRSGEPGEPEPPTIEVVHPISNRQFYQALAMKGEITQDEALAAVVGKIPARFEAVIEHLPADHQFAARMLLTGATTFEREHSLVENFAAALGWSSNDLDGLWKVAAAL
jgi:hypothetical protein